MSKVNNVEEMFNYLVMEITSEATKADKETIERLAKENVDLTERNRILSIAARRTEVAHENFGLLNLLIEKLKYGIESVDGAEKEKLVYNFLDCFFKKDFVENTYEVPLWFGCAVQYYNNRDTIFKILKMLDIKFPGDLESIKHFRLPQDWTEDELDAVFDNMGNHINCNSCYFKDNLRFWKPNALDDPIEVCSHSFTEIPWQFLLRNPLLRKEKYLKEIGRMFCVPEGKYHAYQWLHFAYITQYQELTAEEIKMIIDNIDYTCYNGKDEGLRQFLLKHIELIDNEDFLDIIYNYNKSSYDFKYNNTILRMPRRYIKHYMRDTHDLEWLKKHKDKFTREQITELALAALNAEEE